MRHRIQEVKSSWFSLVVAAQTVVGTPTGCPERQQAGPGRVLREARIVVLPSAVSSDSSIHPAGFRVFTEFDW